jgi:hypothetical protein
MFNELGWTKMPDGKLIKSEEIMTGAVVQGVIEEVDDAWIATLFLVDEDDLEIASARVEAMSHMEAMIYADNLWVGLVVIGRSV